MKPKIQKGKMKTFDGEELRKKYDLLNISSEAAHPCTYVLGTDRESGKMKGFSLT